MNEAEWLASVDPRAMIHALRDSDRPRKLRLFACACCRRISHLIHPSGLVAVALAESYCDGKGVTKSRLKAGCRSIPDAPYDTALWDATEAARAAAHVDLGEPHGTYSWLRAADAADYVARAVLPDDFRGGGMARWMSAPQWLPEQTSQVGLLREIFGVPFRPMWIDPEWRTGDVLNLAGAIREQHAWHTMPILADALLDAGCTNTELIEHCQASVEHARGCWALDALLTLN
jgi:hypothetical protein